MAGHLLYLSLAIIGTVLRIEAIGQHYFPESDQYYYDTGYVSDFTDSEWSMLSGRLNQPKCIDIPRNMSLCRDIGYPKMLLPNLLDHDTLQEVVSQSGSWVPLMRIGCHPDTKLFLCSLFSPVCAGRPIPPCRTLCEAVKAGCLNRMLHYGFPWPDMLQCDQFPLEDGLCIMPQNDNKPNDSLCNACHNPTTFEAIVDSACSSEFVLKFGVEEHMTSGDDLRIVLHSKKKVYRKGTLKKRDLANTVVFVEGGASCDCAPMDSLTGNARRDQYLGMGNKVGDRLILTYLQGFDKNDPDQKKALRAMRKDTICEEGLQHLTMAPPGRPVIVPETTPTPSERPNGRKGKGNKNRRRDRDREGRRRNATTAATQVDDAAMSPATVAPTPRRNRDDRRQRPRKEGRGRSRERRPKSDSSTPATVA